MARSRRNRGGRRPEPGNPWMKFFLGSPKRFIMWVLLLLALAAWLAPGFLASFARNAGRGLGVMVREGVLAFHAEAQTTFSLLLSIALMVLAFAIIIASVKRVWRK